MSDLKSYFENNKGNSINKWMHYFDIYEFWFKEYKNKPLVILEIGVFQGGSLQMWRNYFGSKAEIIGIDINPDCKQFETENTNIFIGSQEDRTFLRNLKKQIPKIDILIDDGGHMMNQQIVAFEELYDHLKDDGIYLCEDLHTSYWSNYNGGYKNPGSFIEYSKNFIDQINAWHSREKGLEVNQFTRTTNSIHYYDSILIIKKELRKPPVNLTIGEGKLSRDSFMEAHRNEEFRTQSTYLKIRNRIKLFFRKIKN